MKKLLLGTSALIGATALVASAQAAAPELTISGSLDFHLVGGENPVRSTDGSITAAVTDVGEDETGWNLRQAGSRSEINFRAAGESDGGTTYGANIDYRYLGSSTDEAYIFVGGDWGRVHLGQDDGAINHRRYYAGSIAPAPFGIDGVVQGVGGVQGAADPSDSNKITYFSPNFNGFQFAASIYEGVGEFELGDVDNDADTDDVDVLAFSEVIEVAASFEGGAGDFTYGVSLGVQQADTSDALGDVDYIDGGVGTAGEGVQAVDIDDLSLWTIGAKFGFGPFSIAGSYSDAGDSGVLQGAPDVDATTAGNQTVDANNDLLAGHLAESREYYDIGVAYDIGGGMSIGISYGEETYSILGGIVDTVGYMGATVSATQPSATGTLTSAVVGYAPQEITNELIAIDFGFPIMEGMVGYAGVAFSETEHETVTVPTTHATATNTSGVSNVAATPDHTIAANSDLATQLGALPGTAAFVNGSEARFVPGNSVDATTYVIGTTVSF